MDMTMHVDSDTDMALVRIGAHQERRDQGHHRITHNYGMYDSTLEFNINNKSRTTMLTSARCHSL